MSIATFSLAAVTAGVQAQETTRAIGQKWRRSEKVQPVPPSNANTPQDVFARPARTDTRTGLLPLPTSAAMAQAQPLRPVAQVADTSRQHMSAATFPATSPSRIQQATYTEGSAPASVGKPAPVGNYIRGPVASNPTRIASQPERVATPNDFFRNPFAESPQSRTPVPNTFQSTRTVAIQPPEGGMELPTNPPNALRDAANGSTQNVPQGMSLPGMEELPPPGNASPTAPGSDTPSPGDSMRGQLSDPSQQQDLQPADPKSLDASEGPAAMSNDTQDSPSDAAGDDAFLFPDESNPFDRRDPRPQSPGPKGDDDFDRERPRDTSSISTNQLSCDEFRSRVARETIDTISLDPSPPFRPDLFDPKDYEQQRAKFEQRQSIRPWSTADGRVVARGKLLNIAYEQVIIETEDGSTRELPVKRLSEGDLGYISDNWGLPEECLIEQVAYTPRAWTPLTMTWKASNACSKSRYFEEVNLERYGHTYGPYLQPLVSSAHFFGSVMVLPYKMGVHPPNECQYALGYYRPGNCAPWIVPPVPISARGALSQAAVMTGSFWLVP
ncbi:MAG: hypothetical protein AAFV88_12945 [Planctomycetota bacterium]